jgi:ribonuclease R
VSRKRRPEPREIDREMVLELLKKENHPLVIRDFVRRLDFTHEEKRALKTLLNKMTLEGQIIRLKGRRYGLPSRINVVVGRLQCHPDGYGFVIAEDVNQPDIFIKPKDLREAMHGDRVAVRIEDLRRRRGRAREGRIVRILERGAKRIVGEFMPNDGSGRVIPDDDRYLFELVIPKKCAMKAREDQVVLAEITQYPTIARNPEGRIIRVLGSREDPEVLPRMVIGEYDLPHRFPAPVLREAKGLPQMVDDGEIAERVDLRGRMTVTIDGENARDFDDAVSMEEGDEGYILWVSISDVGHYVKPGTHLDREAYRRGTSVYFPDRVIPMFPPELSNGICCLHPHMDRLALTTALRFDGEGALRDCGVFKSVIKSDARLTYKAVRRALVDRDPEEMRRYEPLLPSLEAMGRLCSLLVERRRQRGSLDFDLPEPEIVLNLQGEAQEIIKAERNFAHQIIEEFMIAANEAVALKLTQARFPLLYRVHEESCWRLGIPVKNRATSWSPGFSGIVGRGKGKARGKAGEYGPIEVDETGPLFGQKPLSLWAFIGLLHPLHLAHTEVPRPPRTSSTEEDDRGRASIRGGFFPASTTPFPAGEGGDGGGKGDRPEVSGEIHGGKGG